MMEILFSKGSSFAYGYRGKQNGWELLSYPRYSPALALSDHHLFGLLKDHLRGYHYETDEAVQGAVRSWLRGAGTEFCRIFKILLAEMRSSDGDFVGR
jgi:hypothetical protein